MIAPRLRARRRRGYIATSSRATRLIAYSHVNLSVLLWWTHRLVFLLYPLLRSSKPKHAPFGGKKMDRFWTRISLLTSLKLAGRGAALLTNLVPFVYGGYNAILRPTRLSAPRRQERPPDGQRVQVAG
jgi:hypothetical protein